MGCAGAGVDGPLPTGRGIFSVSWAPLPLPETECALARRAFPVADCPAKSQAGRKAIAGKEPYAGVCWHDLGRVPIPLGDGLPAGGSIRSAPRAFAGLQGQWAGPVFRALDQHPAKKLQKGGPERGTDPKAGDPWNGVGCRGRFGRAVGTVVSKSLCVLCGPRASSIPWRESCVLGCWPSGRQRKESAAA